MSELETVIDDVKNNETSRQQGCLSLRSERLLVSEIERLRVTVEYWRLLAEQKCLTGATDQSDMEREADIARAWQDLLDKDDRTSPEEYPEMALITRDELADFITRTASAMSPSDRETP